MMVPSSSLVAPSRPARTFREDQFGKAGKRIARHFGFSGFTLVELLVVIAILAILAATAVPMYVGHISRVQIARTYAEIAQYQKAVDYFFSNGQVSSLTTNQPTNLGFVDSDLSTVTFGTFTDPASSTITATMDGNTSASIRGTQITLSRQVDGTWTCSISGSGGGWSDSLSPAGCD